MPALLVLVRYTYYRTLDTAGSRRSDVPVVPYQCTVPVYRLVWSSAWEIPDSYYYVDLVLCTLRPAYRRALILAVSAKLAI